LNLGLLAYIGGGEAISQVQLGDQRLFEEAGSVGFLLWRSVYLAKQVKGAYVLRVCLWTGQRT